MKLRTIRNLGVIGAGRMGAALIQGWIKAGLLAPRQFAVYDRSEAALERVRQLGVPTVKAGTEVARRCDSILLAVKPGAVGEVLDEIKPLVDSRHLVISIAAGIRLGDLEARLPGRPRVVRVMPNIACLVSACAAAYSLGRYATNRDESLVQGLFGGVGSVTRVEERYMDAVTGLAASGPAFIFMVVEALADGGVRMGLPREAALQLAAQMVYGSAKMVQELGRHPAELKDQVASPAGTTIEGLQVLEQRGLRAALIEAVERATRRAEALSASGSSGPEGSGSGRV